MTQGSHPARSSERRASPGTGVYPCVHARQLHYKESPSSGRTLAEAAAARKVPRQSLYLNRFQRRQFHFGYGIPVRRLVYNPYGDEGFR